MRHVSATFKARRPDDSRLPALPECKRRDFSLLRVAVMGCVVNGPGESKHAHIGISLPGTFEEPKAPVFVDGRLLRTLRGDTIVAEFIRILDEYVETHYRKLNH